MAMVVVMVRFDVVRCTVFGFFFLVVDLKPIASPTKSVYKLEGKQQSETW